MSNLLSPEEIGQITDFVTVEDTLIEDALNVPERQKEYFIRALAELRGEEQQDMYEDAPC